ncbi:MAG: hypothetical protein ABIR94_05560 [Rubrivivax sp.]
MAQTLLALDAHPADSQVGFELGFDHARHGVLPAPEQMHPGNPLYQGWRSGSAHFGQRTLVASRYTRQWLQLRLDAWLRALAFEPLQLTPNHLRQIDVVCCPVTREPLGHDTGGPGDATPSRLSERAGYAAGNLAVLSARAQRALGSLGRLNHLDDANDQGWQAAMQLASQAEDAADGLAGELSSAEWRRLAVLMSFVTEIPHAQAIKLPLCVLPPNRVRLLNPAQGLQALITHRLGEQGWCQQMRSLAEQLPSAGLHHDFNLLVNALLPRLIGADCGPDRVALRHAREEAWCDARVNRRWQHLALQLDPRQTNKLLAAGLELGLAGAHALLHESDTATEGWALATQGRTGRQHPRARQAPAASNVTAFQAVRRADQLREHRLPRLAAY